ncbi:Alkaline phosphatase [Fimbriiglobus ruber]|uniref:Alkaline phosphatase n=1 Tax=Fimbriiglobus ruber TaxID=1908690 RepID=A0A225D062_9BACT|nr:Alkaline phosphatase [Fimbriiglobus ruber]
MVKAYNAETGVLNWQETVFAPSFTGGVLVATADFNKDGYPDVVVAAGSGGGAEIRILDGKTGAQISGPLGAFMALDAGFRGGVSVAAADVDGDGTPDVIVAAGGGGGPRVQVWSGATGKVIADFFAFDPSFRGGTTIAAADFTGSGKASVAVGAGPGGGPQIKVFDPMTGAQVAGPLGSFFAFDPSSRNGVFVGSDSLAGDVNGDGIPDLAVGSGPGAGEVKVFSGADGSVLKDFTPFGSGYTGGVRVGLAYVDDDSYADVVTGTGPGQTAEVRVFSGATGTQLAAPLGDYQPFGATATGGVYVASSNDPGGPPTGSTSTTLTADPSGGTFTANEQFLLSSVVTITAGSGTPTGTVTYAIAGGAFTSAHTLWSGTLGAYNAAAGGYVNSYVVTQPIPAGSYSLSVSYSGDANFLGSGGYTVPTVGSATGPVNQPPTNSSPVGPVQLGSGTNAPAPGASSSTGVIYSTGSIQLSRTDLSSSAGGTSYGQTWSWSSASGYSDGVSGTGATQAQAPHLTQVNGNDSIALVEDGQTAEFFDLYGGTYHSRFYGGSTLTHDAVAGTFTATDGVGNTVTFYDFSGSTPSGRAGKMSSMTDEYGNTTSVTSWATGGLPTEVQQVTGTGSTAATISFVYTYVTSGVNAGLLATVTQRQKIGSGSFATVRSSAYTYYDGTSSNGLAGELELAAVLDASGNTIDTSYYRYYTSGTGSSGNVEYSFGPAAYARLVAALGTSVDSLTDAQVAPYADVYLAYNSAGQVSSTTQAGDGASGTGGGLGTYTYTYTANTSYTGLFTPDVWDTKTVETLPDGNENIVYTNAFGAIILKVYEDTTTSQQWATYYRYDTAGQLVLEASPSAVTGYNDSLPDLVGYTGPGATYLSSSAGQITTNTYATTTTATTSTAGDAAGYLSQTDLSNGTGGSAVPQQSMTYLESPTGTFVPTASTQYRNTNGTGGETTTAAYTWQGSTAQPATVATTLPTVTSGENGPGTAATTTTVYNQYNQPVWQMDAGGFITYTAYDNATGAVVKTIQDVNTADTGDFTNLPSGWTTPSGGGLELITTYQVDALGRTIEETDPNGNVTYTVYDDADHEVRVYPGWNASTDTTTGPIQVTREDRANNYTETFTMSATPHTTGGVPDGTEAITGIQSLTRTYRNSGGQTVATDAYFNLGGLTYSTGTMGTAGVNFYQTQYGYDADGWQNRVVDPTGTITRTVYDGQGRVVSAWVGTDDTPTSGAWSPTNNTSPSNMVETSSDVYDGGGVGDGTLTQKTVYPGGSAAARVTDYWYDWRDRLVAEKDGVEATETDGVNRPLTVTTYDNLNEAIETQQYVGDGVTPSIVSGVLSLPSGTSADLRTQTVTSYDEQGRVYQTQVYDVNPTTGSVSTGALTTNDYYDLRGNQIAESAPGGAWTKDVYDGAGRKVEESVTDGAAGTSYSDAASVTGDHVLTQTQTIYDADGNAIETVTSDRDDNATGTGTLGTPTSGVHARVSYMASYFDAANRDVADVNVGTNGGSAWTRPGSVPTASSTVLVTSNSYSADAVQTVQLTGSPTGGTFTLTFGGQTTSAIAYNATAATVQSDLQGLSSIGSGNAIVTPADGSGWTVRFAGSLAGVYQVAVTGSGASLTGGTLPAVAVGVVSAGGDAGLVQAVTDPLGLVARTYYDALGRTVETVADYTGAAETTTTDVATEYTYDGAGHTLTLTADEPGGAYEQTLYVYGATTAGGSGVNSNDLLVTTEWPDPTTGAPSTSQEDTQTVNALGQVLTSTDRNGSTHTLTYDVLGRVTADAVTTLGSGVDGSVRRIATAYDTQGNAYLTTSYNAASGGSVVNQVEDVYNGLDQLTGEYQAVGGAVNTSTTPEAQYAYTEMAGGVNNSRLTSTTYPDGYVVTDNYASGVDNTISRLTSLSDNTGTLESYKYLGLDTVVERDHPESGVNLTYISQTGSTGDAGDQYTGLDRFGRVVDQNWYDPTTSTSAADLQYGYDADGNVLWRNDLVNTAFGEVYTYDGLNQLATFARGTLNGTKTGISGTASATQSWTPDALGNFMSVTTNGTAQSRTANARNEITSVGGATTPTYDANGNMTTDETGLQYVYDAWNRLVTVKSSGGTTLETNTYDGENRLVTQAISGTTTNSYYSNQWQVLEQQVGTEYTTRNVWSPVYVNAMVDRDMDTSGTGLTATGSGYQRLWPAQDANWNVMALVNGSGTVVERYTYSPYGVVSVLDGSYGSRNGSSYGWIVLFQGMAHDTVSEMDYGRNRWYSETLGRWATTDPIKFRSKDDNFYRFVGNGPLVGLDPSGTFNSFAFPIGANWGAIKGSEVGTGLGFVAGAIVGFAIATRVPAVGIAVPCIAGAGAYVGSKMGWYIGGYLGGTWAAIRQPPGPANGPQAMEDGKLVGYTYPIAAVIAIPLPMNPLALTPFAPFVLAAQLYVTYELVANW